MSKKLHAMLFSDDFTAHSKALVALIDCVKTPEGGKAFYGAEAVACFDLLLKWTSLRFLETNPKVLLKSMQFVKVRMEQFGAPLRTRILWESVGGSVTVKV